METMEHPHIQNPSSFAFLGDGIKQIGVIRQFEKGSLRDLICKVNDPLSYYDIKYNPKKFEGLPLPVIKCLGKQILEAVYYLYIHGFPVHHLHTANVLVRTTPTKKEKGHVVLTDLENSLCGLKPLYYDSLVKNIRSQPEVICFGNVFFEMVYGYPKPSYTDDVFPNTDPQLLEVLTKIFSSPTPSLADLRAMPFFASEVLDTCANVDLSNPWNPKVRSLLKLVRDDRDELLNPSRGRSDERGYSPPSSRSSSPENKKSKSSKSTKSSPRSPRSGRAKSPRSGHKDKSKRSKPPTSTAAPVTRAPPSPSPPPVVARPPPGPTGGPPAPPGGPPAPPPPPTLNLPPPQTGRGSLLEQIRSGNNMQKLKKVSTK
eukprot:TRINITY_DN6954_c0_g1_i1.p1 TRINITY_DN6954_c0_g1~~TRINITY_DN6954_c0_g1_i1.p1  ORF type:complete len:372 (+),score=89.23 TRINITY_DN6954_c0_g1_i1:382-1497(+)